MSNEQSVIDGTGKDLPRKGNPQLEAKDSVKVYNWIRDVLAEKKTFVGFVKDSETGELVEVSSQRRIMPRYLE